MALVTLKEILKEAENGGYGVGLFNILNLEMTRGIIKAAEAERSPLILGVAEVHLSVIPFDWAANLMKKAAKDADVPVCLHFDHGMTKEAIRAAVDAGFTSVMYDGSSLPYEENVRNTREIVEMAKERGVSVEAELGHVGQGADPDDPSAFYTEPDEVEDFVKRTEIDALAVAVGTAHGNYIRKPVLDLKRLVEIKKVSAVPLVLHGGSGLTDEDFRATIKNGIRKINIFTDIAKAAAEAAEKRGSYEDTVTAVTEAVAKTTAYKMRVFGSGGKA